MRPFCGILFLLAPRLAAAAAAERVVVVDPFGGMAQRKATIGSDSEGMYLVAVLMAAYKEKAMCVWRRRKRSKPMETWLRPHASAPGMRWRSLALLTIPFLLRAQDAAATRESALGASLAAEQHRRMTRVADEVLDTYLSRLAGRFRSAPTADVPVLRASIVANEPDGPLRAPLALPGGYLLVPARMIAEARDEQAFAGLVAHAVAHIAEGHTAPRRLGDSRMDTIPLLFFNGFDGPPGGKVLVPRAALAMQEQWESQAGTRAAALMSAFTPDPEFAAVQAEARRLVPPRKAQSLRRASEPVR